MRKETLELIERIKKDLKEMLSEHRYNHSIGVMNKAIELAKIYGVDEDKAALAGLTHDIAKEIPNEESFKIAKDNNVEIDDFIKINSKLIHGKIGAILVKQKYGLDEQIQKAIEFHTETTPDMDMLGKIIYVADKIDETRTYAEQLEQWRNLVKKNIDETIIQIINFNTKKLIDENRMINLIMLETRNKLLIHNKVLDYPTNDTEKYLQKNKKPRYF